MSKAEFLSHFRALNNANAAAQKNHEIADIPFKTWDGGQYKNLTEDMKIEPTNDDAHITINFNKMSNAFDDSDCKYTGIADGAPISCSEHQGSYGDKIRVNMDTVKFAEAVHAEKAASGKYDGRENALNASKSHIDMFYSYTQANNGVTSVSEESMINRIGQCVAQRYVLTATSKDPDAQKPSKELISNIGKSYTNMFDRFMQNLSLGQYNWDFKTKEGIPVKGTAIKNDVFYLQEIRFDDQGDEPASSDVKINKAYAIIDKKNESAGRQE